jgi:hypothetical protein
VVLAEQYARKALALASDLAGAHASLGFALHRHRVGEAEPELRRGVELNPNYVSAHQLYVVHLLTMGRPVRRLRKRPPLQLDPYSLPVNNLRG